MHFSSRLRHNKETTWLSGPVNDALLKLESLIRLCLIIIINDIFPVEVILAPKIAV